MSWKEHIKKVRESGDLTYKQAMVAASKSWKPNNKLTRIQESRDKAIKKPKSKKIVKESKEDVPVEEIKTT